jgi:hypothetical protein
MKKKIGSSKVVKKMKEGGSNYNPGDKIIFRASTDNTRVSKAVNDGSINKAKIAEQKDAYKNAKRILKEGKENNDSLGYFYEKLTPQQQTRLTDYKKGGTVSKTKTVKAIKKSKKK